MKRWQLIDTGDVPGSKGKMQLYQAGRELLIRVDGQELMSSRMHGSEDALAELAYDKLGQRSPCAVLVGGLGMGFTLAAALRCAPAHGEVVVAELVPAVVRWNHGPIGEVAKHPLRDPRTTVFEGDVGAAYRGKSEVWDAILLDVDNGPDGLSRAGNNALYSASGLRAAKRALRPGGVLAVWSADPDDGFTHRLRRAGFEVVVHTVRAHGRTRGPRHTVWVAVRKG